MEIHRPGLVEWYVNSPAGLEQGFTLEERPAGAGPLVVEFAVAGGRPSLRGDAIVFETSAQRRLRYGELEAIDAEGNTLVARLEVPGAERLQIVVDDADAIYPLVIDPILTETADTQLESDQANAFLGFSVAGAGDVNEITEPIARLGERSHTSRNWIQILFDNRIVGRRQPEGSFVGPLEPLRGG